jgi:four helix bundle protein
MEMGEDINKLVNSFPKKEMYNLTSQIRRASDSMALNISEGSILQSGKEYKKFLRYSIRSLAETVTCLFKAKSRNYLSEKEFDIKYRDCYNLMNMMITFRTFIKSKN